MVIEILVDPVPISIEFQGCTDVEKVIHTADCVKRVIPACKSITLPL